jgi:hypothetical protein
MTNLEDEILNFCCKQQKRHIVCFTPIPYVKVRDPKRIGDVQQKKILLLLSAILTSGLAKTKHTKVKQQTCKIKKFSFISGGSRTHNLLKCDRSIDGDDVEGG